MLMSLSVAWRSISASSSSVKSSRSSAATLASSCATLEAPDEGRGHPRIAQHPGDRHLRERLAAGGGELVQRPHLRQRIVREQVGGEGRVLCDARALGDAVEVLVREQSLAERGEGDAADALVPEHVEQLLLDPAVQQRVRGLVDEERRAEAAQDRRQPRASSPPSRTRCRRRAPCPGAPRCPARPSSPRAASPGRSGASRRCPRSRAPCGAGSGRGSRAGTCGSPTRRTGRATCRSRPSSRSRARHGTTAGRRPAAGRSSPRRSRTAGRSCSPGRSG